ncbi:MAG: hypothetical protein ACOCU1_00600 [Bacillota bacterium]
MHKMEETPKILTLLGLIIEGVAFLVFVGLDIFVRITGAIPKEEFIEEGMTPEEADLFISAMRILGNIFLVIAILLFIMFIVNFILFRKLMRGQFDEDQAKKIYLYQAIWGGISLSFNTITGVLYLISAVQTHSKRYLISTNNKRGK